MVKRNVTSMAPPGKAFGKKTPRTTIHQRKAGGGALETWVSAYLADGEARVSPLQQGSVSVVVLIGALTIPGCLQKRREFGPPQVGDCTMLTRHKHYNNMR